MLVIGEGVGGTWEEQEQGEGDVEMILKKKKERNVLECTNCIANTTCRYSTTVGFCGSCIPSAFHQGSTMGLVLAVMQWSKVLAIAQQGRDKNSTRISVTTAQEALYSNEGTFWCKSRPLDPQVTTQGEAGCPEAAMYFLS